MLGQVGTLSHKRPALGLAEDETFWSDRIGSHQIGSDQRGSDACPVTTKT